MGKIFRRSTSTSSQQSKSSEFELEDYNVEDLLSIGILSYDLVCDVKTLNFLVFFTNFTPINLVKIGSFFFKFFLNFLTQNFE